jgi:Tetracyclin repressor-like, C-terminal domain
VKAAQATVPSRAFARAESILAARSTHLPPDRIKRYARVGVQLVKALLPLVAMAKPAERAALVGELKAVQRAYLAPEFGQKAATAARAPARASSSGSSTAR